LVSPGTNASYITLTVTAFSSGATGNEIVSFNATASNGLTVQLSPGSVKLVAGFPVTTAVTVFASPSATPGNYTLTVAGTSGSISHSQPLAVRVVDNLVYMQKFAFSPGTLTVTPGTTVYFYNADAAHNWCGVSDSGAKSIMFTTIISTTSPVMSSFTIWSITLTTPGSYTYSDSIPHAYVAATSGTIIVSG